MSSERRGRLATALAGFQAVTRCALPVVAMNNDILINLFFILRGVIFLACSTRFEQSSGSIVRVDVRVIERCAQVLEQSVTSLRSGVVHQMLSAMLCC